MWAPLTLISTSERSDHALCDVVHVKAPKKEGKYDRRRTNFSRHDADLLRRALSEVKTKVYEESEASLDDTQAPAL